MLELCGNKVEIEEEDAEEDGVDSDNVDGHDDDDSDEEGCYTEAAGQDVKLVGNGGAGSQSMMDIMMGNPSDANHDDEYCPPLHLGRPIWGNIVKARYPSLGNFH